MPSRRVAAAHPDTVKVESLARSKEGRDVWIATIGPASKGAPAKPSILVVANLEADHLVGAQVALGLIERLAGASSKTLEGRTILYRPPAQSGRCRAAAEGNAWDRPSGRTSRASTATATASPTRTAPTTSTAMAWPCRCGSRTPRRRSFPTPRTLGFSARPIPTKGERPVYSESTEGLDDDGDGSIDEDPVGGVNLNRNWPHGWTEYTPETGAYPTSEPEVNGLIRFAYAHPEIVAVWSFGLNDNLKGKPDATPRPIPPQLTEIVKAFANATAPKAGTPRNEAAKKIQEAEPKKEEPKAEAPKEEPAKKAKAPPAANARTRGRGGPGGGEAREHQPSGPAASVPAPGLDATTDGALSEWAYQQFGVVGLSSRLWPQPEARAGRQP